jgi:ribokinase
MKSFDVALFGSVFVDHVLTGFLGWPKPGEEVFAEHYHREAGGGCFNTACGLAKLGASTTCFSAVGRTDSQWLLNRVRDFGVCADQVRFSGLPTALTVVMSLADDRSFFTFDGANHELTSWLDSPGLPAELAAAKHVHFAYPLPPDPGLRIVQALHALGSTVSLDVGWQAGWLKDDKSWSLLPELDWFFPNQDEGALMTGKLNPEEMLRAFASRGGRGVAVKLGPHGAACLSGARMFHKPAAIAVKAIDTTGAGDAFNAGFLHAYLSGLAAEVCVERGVICGSLSVRKAGSLDALPGLNDVLQYHEHYERR